MLIAVLALLLLLMSALAYFWLIPSAPVASGGIPFAVIGDSDSHAYQDTILIPVESGRRGGKLRPYTFQWTEIMAKLRADEIDQGAWGVWGTPIKIAETLDWLGIGGRAPRKRDFRYNFAVSGAECSELLTGYYRQAPRLLTEMNRAPEMWKRGVVFIQIGVNTLGQNRSLERYAKNGLTAEAKAEIHECVDLHRRAIKLIADSHPDTRFVIASLFDNSDLSENLERWNTPGEIANISAAIDEFDSGLKQLVAGHSNMAFIDARTWFRSHWGGRDANGKLVYKSVNLGGKTSVTNSIGDEPVHAVLKDGHGSVVYNALWTGKCIETLNAAFGTQIRPITREEIAQLADPAGTYGLR